LAQRRVDIVEWPEIHVCATDFHQNQCKEPSFAAFGSRWALGAVRSFFRMAHLMSLTIFSLKIVVVWASV